jgi:hypothetical protein
MPENRPECTDYCSLARKRSRKTPLSLEPTLLRTGCAQVRILGLSPPELHPALKDNIKVGRERERRRPWIPPGTCVGAGWPPEFSSPLRWLSKTPC